MVEDSLDEEGEEMVADDAQKGSIPMRSGQSNKSAEQIFIEQVKVFEVVER